MSEKTFTESLSILKQTADEISKPSTTLEDALKLFEQGMKESEYCTEILNKAEQKILVYTSKED